MSTLATSGDTLELELPLSADQHETVIAELDTLGFTAFLEEDDRLLAYLPAAGWSDALRAHIDTWLEAAGLPALAGARVIPMQDWNAPWEASIQPIPAGRFHVRATWHPPLPADASAIELVIDPKMSFGTGHHESTRLVLGFLPEVIRPGDFVLDAGTGTGILGIAAHKLGAGAVIAYDNDPWIEENALENIRLNGSDGAVTLRIGEEDVVPETGFDVILANINKHILIAAMPAFVARLRPGGTLILAGLLVVDRDDMLSHAAAHGLSPRAEARENTWWSVQLHLDTV